MGMSFDLAILYRGSLESCNYDCWYCPFAKAQDDAESLRVDEQGLRRFVDWVRANSGRKLGILFTPWGEALVRDYYRAAFIELSRLPHVGRVVAQTNLSYPLDWLGEADRESAALWCSYHPSETARGRFVAQSKGLADLGIRHSVGVVGLKENFDEIRALHAELPPGATLWINAYKREASYYTNDDIAMLTRVDATFPLNNRYHASRGKPCHAGENAITVDGEGTVRRCHFIDSPLGSLYEDDLDDMLRPRTCSNETCHCYIGYSHLKELGLRETYGPNVLERILPGPAQRPGTA